LLCLIRYLNSLIIDTIADNCHQLRQAVGHVLWEMVTWLDRYLKK